jgi:hypothetical protein
VEHGCYYMGNSHPGSFTTVVRFRDFHFCPDIFLFLLRQEGMRDTNPALRPLKVLNQSVAVR